MASRFVQRIGKDPWIIVQGIGVHLGHIWECISGFVEEMGVHGFVQGTGTILWICTGDGGGLFSSQGFPWE